MHGVFEAAFVHLRAAPEENTGIPEDAFEGGVEAGAVGLADAFDGGPRLFPFLRGGHRPPVYDLARSLEGRESFFEFVGAFPGEINVDGRVVASGGVGFPPRLFFGRCPSVAHPYRDGAGGLRAVEAEVEIHLSRNLPLALNEAESFQSATDGIAEFTGAFGGDSGVVAEDARLRALIRAFAL